MGLHIEENRIRQLVVLHVKNGQVTFRITQMLLHSFLKTIIIAGIQTWKTDLGVIQWIPQYDGNFVPYEMIQYGLKIGFWH